MRMANGGRFDLATKARANLALAVMVLYTVLPLAPLPLAAQDLVGREILAIEYRGLKTLAEDSMNYYLGLEVGQRYEPQRLNESIREFWSRGMIDDVTVSAEPQDSGMKLVIEILERPLLRSIDYQGLDKVKRSDIADATDKERIEVYEGLPLDRGELVRLQKAIEALYAERGYRFAVVDVDIEWVSDSEQRVVVTVDEGNKVKIGQVAFEGNEVFSTSKLRGQMKKTKKSNLITRIRKRDVYNPATVEEDLEAVRDLYRSFGYKDVELGEPEIEVIGPGGQVVDGGGTSPDPQADDGDPRGKRRLRIIIPVEEGPRWKLGEIRFEGNEVLQSDLLRSVFEQPKGGWLRSDVIEDGVEKIKEFYNNTGYIFADVRQELVESDPEELIADVLIKVAERDQFRAGRIEFQGNSRTRDRVLRRELRLQEGMVFNSAALRNSLLKINQLEYFKLEENAPVDIDTKTESNTVDLVIKGDEAERTELQFGGGYSEIDGFFGQASVRTRNFLGRGETLGVSLQSGRFRDLFDLSYFVPWLFDKPQSVGIQLFNRDLDFDLLVDQTYIRKETGAVLTYGRSFKLFQSTSVSYTNSELEDFRAQRFFFDPNVPEGTLIEQEFAFRKSSLTFQYRYDSHDSRLEPTRGKRLVTSVEYAGGPLGGENYFVRPRLQLSYTKPVARRPVLNVFRANLDLGYIESFGDVDGEPRELFFLDRFYLGGENSLRGFNFRSVWVRDPVTGRTVADDDGFPQGGNRSFQINLEHHFVLDGPFRLLVFADAGNVFGKDQSFDLDTLRYVAGLELRINVPLFGAPLRFIWSNLLNPYDDLPVNDRERFESFDFSIGVSF